MGDLVYGVWDGIVYGGRQALPQKEPLCGLEDFAPYNATLAFIADRGFLVFDRNISLVEVFRQYMQEAAKESCGRCAPCRVGTQRIRDLLHRLSEGKGNNGTLNEVREMATQVANTSLCGMGQSCARSLLEAIEHFSDQFKPSRPAQLLWQHSFSYTTAPCMEACPSKIDVPRYIDGVKGGKIGLALGVVMDKYPMAATCGRVCVRFCESACRRGDAEGAVAIRLLKRYAADDAMKNNQLQFKKTAVSINKRVAVIGAGPAGITCAYKLLQTGVSVDVFDAQEGSGGMALTGIPNYRLAKGVLKAETEDIIRQLGGEFFYKKTLGRDFSLNGLFDKGYDAVFLAYGASKGSALGVKNENAKLDGYISGVDFLHRVYQYVTHGKTFNIEGDVIVIGGGNVAMDCVRSAKRMGARSVHLVYRRTIDDMPADREEIEACKHEGIIFHCLVSPSSLIVENGCVTGVELLEMRQTDTDAKGRRNVEPVPGKSSVKRCNLLVAAIGQIVEKDVLSADQGVAQNRWNCITVNPDTLETSRRGVFAGGDCVSGPETLVNALDHGERAAASILEYLTINEVSVRPQRLMQGFLAKNRLLDGEKLKIMPLRNDRAREPAREVQDRIKDFDEVDLPLSREAAYNEANRCLRCYRIYSVITSKPLTHEARVGGGNHLLNGSHP